MERVPDSCESSKASSQGFYLIFIEAAEARDGYVSDGELVEILYENLFSYSYLGAAVFNWPVIQLSVPLEDAGVATFYGEVVADHFIWGRWEERYGNCVSIWEEERPAGFQPSTP